MKKPGKRILLIVLVFLVLIAAFYTEEDWRGKHDWEKCQRQAEARGEVLDWNAYLPPSVPDNENFFKAPIFDSISEGHYDPKTFTWIRNTNVADPLYMNIISDDLSIKQARGGGYWAQGTTTDLTDSQRYYREVARETGEFPATPQPQTPAADVLLALSKYDSAIEELRAAAQRPYAQSPAGYSVTPVAVAQNSAYLIAFKRCVQVLQMRAIAELQNGESQKAAGDVQLMLRLNDSMRDVPTLIAQLVRVALVDETIQPIYEGLVNHQWSDAQLAGLEQGLGHLDFVKHLPRVITSEEAETLQEVDYWRDHRSAFAEIISYRYGQADYDTTQQELERSFMRFIGYIIPDGWFYQDEVAIVHSHEQWNAKCFDPAGLNLYPHAVDQFGKSRSWAPRNLITPDWSYIESALARRSAHAGVGIDLAETACALERYHLAHGNYPQSLDDLSPQFIASVPDDICGGKPLHYHRTTKGHFLLYSIGWNERDDGGVMGYGSGSNMPRFELGDWVWPNERSR